MRQGGALPTQDEDRAMPIRGGVLLRGLFDVLFSIFLIYVRWKLIKLILIHDKGRKYGYVAYSYLKAVRELNI